MGDDEPANHVLKAETGEYKLTPVAADLVIVRSISASANTATELVVADPNLDAQQKEARTTANLMLGGMGTRELHTLFDYLESGGTDIPDEYRISPTVETLYVKALVSGIIKEREIEQEKVNSEFFKKLQKTHMWLTAGVGIVGALIGAGSAVLVAWIGGS